MAVLPLRQDGKRWLAGLGIVVLTLGSTPATNAQETEEEKPESTIRQEIIVTSAHPELPGSTELEGSDIQARPHQDLMQSLREETGLDAARRGSANFDPNVRGLVETQVGTFVDGTRMFAAGPARMDSELSHISPQMVDRMQIVKGPYALTWGAGTLGAINVETYKPGFAGGLSGRAGVRYGDNAESTDAYGGVSTSADRWRFNVFANSRQGGDYEDGDGVLIPGDHDSAEARLNFGLQVDQSTVLDFTLGYQEQNDLDFPGRLLDATYFYARSYGAELSRAFSGNVSELFVQLYDNRKDHLMNNLEKPTYQPNPNRIPPFGLDVDLPTESNTFGGRGYVTWGGGNWAWQAGTDFYRLEQTATRFITRRDLGVTIFTDNVWPDAEIEDIGAYLQGVLRRGNMELGATVRVDSVDASASPAKVSDFFLDSTTGDLDQSETNVSAAVSARWALSNDWSVNAGLGQAVRTPTTLERFSDRFPSTKFQVAAEFMGDPEIEAETGRQLDLGVQYLRSGLSFQANLFYRVIDDYITIEADPKLPRRLPLSPVTVYRYRNGDEAEVNGGELQVRHQASDWVAWRAGLSLLDAEDTFFDEPAFGTPPSSAHVGVSVGPPSGDYWIDLGVSIVDDQDDVATSRLERPTEGYEVVDLVGGYRFDAGVVLRLGIQNVADERYVNHLNSLNPFLGQRIPEMGRNIFAGIEYRP